MLTPTQGRLRAMLYTQQAVAAERYRADGASLLQVRIPKNDLLRILSAAGVAFEDLTWDEQTITDDVDQTRDYNTGPEGDETLVQL